jgi:ATP-binding cassette, subfamily B, bacterial
MVAGWEKVSFICENQLRNNQSSSSSHMSALLSNGQIIRRLLSFAWNYRWACIGLLLLQAMLLLLTITTIQGVGLGIDCIRYYAHDLPTAPQIPGGLFKLEETTAWQTIFSIAMTVLATELLRACLNSLYLSQAGYLIHAKIVVDLRAKVYDKLQRLSFRFFDAHATGSLINRVTGDVQAVRAFIDGVLIHLILLLISIVCYITYLLSIHRGLTLACLATTPVLWLLTSLFSRRVRPMYDEHREHVDDLILRLSENVQGMPVIKGFGREALEIDKFSRSNDKVRDQQHEIFSTVSLFTPLIGFCTQINLVVLLIYGGWLVANNELQLGSGLVVFAGLLQQFSSQVANLTNLTNSIQQSLSGARRVFEVLYAPSEVTNAAEPIRVDRLRGDITLEHVTFGYISNLPRLRDIHVHIPAGTCVAVLGSTGAGKTTLLHLLCRFYDPQGGAVLLDGLPAKQIHLEDLRRNVGLVFQETFLFSNTVAANIAYGHPYATQEQIEQAAKIAAADEFIQQLPQKYETILGESGLDLSGGQRQRIAIARAVLLNPAILLLDDPAASVDPHTEEEILSAMDSAKQGRTTFVVAHRLSTLRRADLVIVLEEGRITQMGNYADLLQANGHFRDTALLQLQSAAGMHGA